MAMNPDVNDPVWRKLREKQWKPIKRELREEHSRKDIEIYQSWFMGDVEFSYRDDLPWDAVDNDFVEARRYSPFQCPERWLQFVFEDGPHWLGKRHHLGSYERLSEDDKTRTIMRLVASITGLSDGLTKNYGWDTVTQVECNQLFMGGRYSGNECSVNGHIFPFPHNLNSLYEESLSSMYDWLVYPANDNEVIYATTDYLFSILDGVHPVLMQGARSTNGQGQMKFRQRRVIKAVRAFGNFRKYHLPSMLEEGLKISDEEIARKEKFIDYFVSKVEALTNESMFKSFFFKYKDTPQVYGKNMLDGVLSPENDVGKRENIFKFPFGP